MSTTQLKSKAKTLYDERQANAGSPGWNRDGFIKRARRLASQVCRKAQDRDERDAFLYLSVIAVREEIDFSFKP